MSDVAVIDRPDIKLDEATHAYTLDGVPVPGVSSIAKIGSESWGPAGWWGWGIALQGVVDLYAAHGAASFGDVERLRAAMKGSEWTPNRKRDAAGHRGTAVHDALERLARDDEVPDPEDYPAAERGHVLSLVRWYLHYRPQFVATEVVVGSRTHQFAGRYDLRADLPGLGLCLIDLKTSKGVYPDTHFPQLEGYELASTEMGFPASDGGRWLLRTSEDGSFVPHDALPRHRWSETNMVRSWADAGWFLGYLKAYRERERGATNDPAAQWRREVESWLLVAVSPSEDDPRPKLSRELAELPAATRFGLDSRSIGRVLGKLKERGLVEQGKAKRWAAVA